MSLTINTFSDLLHIVNTNPEWRRKLVKALFPEIDVPKALQELAEAQRRTEAGLQRLEKLAAETFAQMGKIEIDLAKAAADHKRTETESASDRQAIRDEMKAGFAEAAADRQRVETEAATDRQEIKLRLDQIDHTLRDLKGDSYERSIRDKAAGIFGVYARRGRDVKNEIGQQLEDAEDDGHISEQEHVQVLASDLLWGGKLKKTKEQVVLVIEVSWCAERTDVERAVNRAAILRRIGIHALPIVAGKIWAKHVPELALRQGVGMVTDFRLDKSSWQAGIAAIS